MSTVSAPSARAVACREGASERLALLTRLYAEQAALGDTEYLREHARPQATRHHVDVFEWYAPRLAGCRAVLDWGCNHGPDACLLRHRFGDALDLHACDFIAEREFAAFRAYARARYAQLSDPFALPYPAARFDAVVGSGVLEHTAMDGEALKDVYRVLRPFGLLVITYLPFAGSWDERRLRAGGAGHRRLYSRAGAAELLLSHGFEPLVLQFHGDIPLAGAAPRPLWPVLRPFGRTRNRVTRALWERVLRPLLHPPSAQAAICCVARKMTVM